jgi:small nuclear ribonucleoprotein (snRNP)-like protein
MKLGIPCTDQESAMIEEFLNQRVVVDLRSEYVCLGTLQRVDEHFIELRNADMHDLRDSDTTRENYVAASRATGVKRNRRRLLLVRTEIVAIARLEDVVESEED